MNAAVWHDLYGVACFREQLRIVSRVLAVKFTFLPPSRFTWKVPNLHIFFSLLKLYLDSFWNELMLIGVGGMDFEGRIRYLNPFNNIFFVFYKKHCRKARMHWRVVYRGIRKSHLPGDTLLPLLNYCSQLEIVIKEIN